MAEVLCCQRAPKRIWGVKFVGKGFKEQERSCSSLFLVFFFPDSFWPPLQKSSDHTGDSEQHAARLERQVGTRVGLRGGGGGAGGRALGGRAGLVGAGGAAGGRGLGGARVGGGGARLLGSGRRG